MAGKGGANGIIFALIGGILIYSLAMGTTYPLLGIVLADEVTGLWNGLNAAATGLGLLAGVLVVPFLGRLIGAGWTVLFGVTLMAMSLFALAFAKDFWLMFGLRLLLGCGANMLFVVAETALNVFSAPARRGRVMGVYTSASAFGFVVGPAVVAVASDQPMVLLLICGAVTTFALLPLGAVRPPVDGAVRPVSASRILPSVALLPFAFAFLVVASAIDAVAISLLPIIALKQSYPVESGALFVTIFHVGLLLGQPVIGAALDIVGRRRTILACCAASLACTIALVFGDRLGFWLVSVLMFVWGGANYGLYTAGLALIGDRFSGEALTAATAAFAAVYAAASVVAPILAGGSIEFFGAAGFYLAVSGIYLMAALCGALFFLPQEPTLGQAGK